MPRADSVTSRSTSREARVGGHEDGRDGQQHHGQEDGQEAQAQARVIAEDRSQAQHDGQQHDHQGVRRHGAADVGEVDAEQLQPAGVADVEAQRQRHGRGREDGQRRDDEVLEEPVRDAGLSLPGGTVREEGEELLHAQGPPAARAHGVSRRSRPTSAASTTQGQDDRADGSQVDLRVEVGLQALGDELAEAAEAAATDDGGHRDEADRRHRGHADAGHDERHGERQLDTHEAPARRVAHGVRGLPDLRRHRAEPGHGVDVEDEQRVGGERDDGRQQREPGDGDEHREGRQAGDRVEQPGHRRDRADRARAPQRQDGERQGDEEAGDHGHDEQLEVLPGLVGDVVEVRGDPVEPDVDAHAQASGRDPAVASGVTAAAPRHGVGDVCRHLP